MALESGGGIHRNASARRRLRAFFFFFFYFCPVNETKVMGRARLILLPYQPWRTDEWGTGERGRG